MESTPTQNVPPTEQSLAPTVNPPLPTIEIDVASVIVENRIRETFTGIEDLAESIDRDGLIQPIVVTYDHRLIAGERRLRAHKLLKRTKIKCVYLECVDEAHKVILEASENIVRRDFTWQEHVLAIDKVHSTKSIEYALKSEAWGVRETGRLLNTAKSSIGRAVFIATFLRANDPEVSKAENLKEAYEILIKRRENELAKAFEMANMATIYAGARANKNSDPVTPQTCLDRCFDEIGIEVGPVICYGDPLDINENIIYQRYERNRRFGQLTHFISNNDSSVTASLLSDRIVDRMRDLCQSVFYPGESHRGT